MRSLFLFIVSSIFAVSTFAQNGQTVTLVFVTASSETYKNYEAVIDDVSYYSENSTGNNRTSNNRNTIWLNNFQPGQHTIQVYSLKNGSNEERATTAPVYTSTFNVRQGFDTKIAVRNNGQVQFSERQGIDNGNQNTAANNGDYNRNTKDGNGDYSTGNQNRRRSDQDNTTTNNGNDETVNTNGNNDGNNNGSYPNRSRHDRNNSTTNNGNENGSVNNDGDSDGNYGNGTNQNRRMNRNRNNTNSDGGYDNQNKEYNIKVAMSDEDFTLLKDNISKQWIPGSKMTSLRNEFATGGHYFTATQAKELIEFVTDENNRLELAKASYPIITDQENFRQVYDVFRSQASKDEMDRFIRNYQNQN